MKEQDIRKVLSEKLREFRLNNKLTAKEVGDQIGKSAKTVSGWEHGRGQPDADTLFALCEIYHINSIAEFYPSENGKKENAHEALSAEEQRLLSWFRMLNANGRDLLMNTAESFAGNPAMLKEASDAKAI